MKSSLFASLFLFPIALFANPIPLFEVKEIQVAPDSFEKIELKWYGWDGNDYILDDFMLITSDDTFFLDSGVCADSFSRIVLLSDSNVPGFHLNDTQDSIIIKDTTFQEGRFIYSPVVRYWDNSIGPTPPPNTSASYVDIRVGYGMEGWIYYPDWYIDSTPTFGNYNDDYPGCKMSGKVFDKDSVPVKGIKIHIRHPHGQYCYYDCEYEDVSDTDGSYSFDSIVTQHYQVYIISNIYTADTLQTYCCVMSPVENLNIYLHQAAIEENEVGNLEDIKLEITPNPFINTTNIRLESPGVKISEIRVYDAGGRLVTTLPISSGNYAVWDAYDNKGQKVKKGVYFCRLKAGFHALTRKLVLM